LTVRAIEFPCAYPIKIVGDNTATFVDTVVALTQRHAPEVTERDVEIRESRARNYVSVTITIRATGEAQLAALHASLRACESVRLVL
jgi:putative lipoic acid-binding regulatory protein